jgi:hypothetical protein
MSAFYSAIILIAASAANVSDLVTVAPGWSASIVAEVDQSYAGWDVEIGDADNDGLNEILTTDCPDSRLYLFKHEENGWDARLLAENLAEHKPGMGLSVRVADLNDDHKNEVVLGTGQEGAGTAFLYIFQTDGHKITHRASSCPECNKSGFTHNLAFRDLDGDGISEIISAYCGGGEIVRYDIDASLSKIDARLIHKLSGSGEESIIADVDNDGAPEFLTSNGFRAGRARVEIYEFDDKGELILPPRVAVDGYDGHSCFYASLIVGDFDNDGANDLIVGWKEEQKDNKATLLQYRVADDAKVVRVLDSRTEDLDMAYFEKMMAVDDADNDGKNELYVSTRGDNVSEFIDSKHLGRVYRYSVEKDGTAQRELLADFNEAFAESSWLAVGDADNDKANEIALATGKGDRTKPGTSYVLTLKRSGAKE